MKLKNVILKPLRLVKKMICDDRASFEEYAQRSFSLEGEDILFQSYLFRYVHVFKMLPANIMSDGFYLDIGAHHPRRHSNTCLLYRRGWTGINIDPMPGSKELFDKERPKDINLEIAVSDVDESSTYYLLDDPGVKNSGRSGFLSEERVNFLSQSQGSRVSASKEINKHRLGQILDQHLPAGKEIDLLNIDVEGPEIAVLRSNNWEKYSPKFIFIEMHEYGIRNFNELEVPRFLEKYNYVLLSKLGITALFVRGDLFPK